MATSATYFSHGYQGTAPRRRRRRALTPTPAPIAAALHSFIGAHPGPTHAVNPQALLASLPDLTHPTPPAPLPPVTYGNQRITGPAPLGRLLASSGIAPDVYSESIAAEHGLEPSPEFDHNFENEMSGGRWSQYLANLARHELRAKENLIEPTDFTDLALLASGGIGLKAFKTAAELGAAATGIEGGATATTAAGEAAQASRLAKAASAAGQIASAPIRHPFLTASSPAVAEIPGAVAKGSPTQLLRGFEGTGVLAGVLGSAGNNIESALPGLLGRAASNLVDLPAQVLPSVYLSLKAGANAVGGDPTELHKLQQGYDATSPIPALLKGEFGRALHNASENPVYAALEGLGIKSAIGHGITGIGRVAGKEDFQAGRHRPDIGIDAEGNLSVPQGVYSPDYFKRRRQERADAARGPLDQFDRILATPKERLNYYKHDVVDRMEFANNAIARKERRRIKGELDAVKPSEALQGIASLRNQGLLSADAKVAVLDLAKMRKRLVDVQKEGRLEPGRLKANQELVKQIDLALQKGDLSELDAFAKVYAEVTKPSRRYLGEVGAIHPEQAAKRDVQPYAFDKMGAQFGLPNSKYDPIAHLLETTPEEARAAAERAASAQLTHESAGTFGDPVAAAGERAYEEVQKAHQYANNQRHHETLDANGDPLSTEQIVAHMVEHAPETGIHIDPATGLPDEISMVTQKPPRERDERQANYAGNASEAPRGIHGPRYTGKAQEEGTFDPSYEQAELQAVRSQTLADRFKGFYRIFDKVGIRKPDGKAWENSRDANDVIANPENYGVTLPPIKGGYVAVRLAELGATKETLNHVKNIGQDRLQEGLDPSKSIEGQTNDAITRALGEGDGPTVIVPRAVMERLRMHNQALYTFEKIGQGLTGAFKSAVLPTSVSWFTGNAIDNWIIRTFGTGIGPTDIRAGKAFKDIIRDVNSEDVANYAIESMLPGTLVGSHPRTQVHRDASSFEGSFVEPVVKGIHDVLEKPGVRNIASLWRKYRDGMFELDSKFFEQTPQYGQLAKVARKELGYTRKQFLRAVQAGEPAIIDLAKGFRNTDAVNHYAREIEKVFGNWGKNGPAARRFLSTWAPFWMWGRSALKFAMITLPRDHPALTGIIAGMEQMTREERQKLGFDFNAEEPLPNWLQGSIPDPFGGAGGVAKLTNLTTFGTFADPTGFASQLAFPTVSAGVLAGMGLDWKLDELRRADGRPATPLEKAKAALFGTAEAYIPFLNSFRAVLGGGAEGLAPVKTYSAEKLEHLREPHTTIDIPVSGSSSGSSSSSGLGALDDLFGESSSESSGSSSGLDALDGLFEE